VRAPDSACAPRPRTPHVVGCQAAAC
jgi:hypothetical protein